MNLLLALPTSSREATRMFTHISLLYWTRTSVRIPLRFLCWLCSSPIFQIRRSTFAWILRRLSFIRFVFFFETSSYPSDFLYSVLSDRLPWVHFSLYGLVIFCLFFVVLKDYSFDIKSNHLSIIYSYITKLLLDAVCCMIFIDHLGWFEDKLSTWVWLWRLLLFCSLSLISSVLTVLSSCLSLSSMYISHSLYIIINILTTLFTVYTIVLSLWIDIDVQNSQWPESEYLCIIGFLLA